MCQCNELIYLFLFHEIFYESLPISIIVSYEGGMIYYSALSTIYIYIRGLSSEILDLVLTYYFSGFNLTI